VLVVVSHFPQVIPIERLWGALDHEGAAGVTTFFVLSGFVLTYNHFDQFRQATDGTRAFLRARLARIWPMNVVALVVITPIIVAWATTVPSPLSWVVNLLMLQALVPSIAMNTWNIPAWSVSCELVFYCAFPFFVSRVLGKVHGVRRLWRLAVGLFAVQVVAFVAVAIVADRVLSRKGKSALDVTEMLERFKFFPGLQIWSFLIGCVVGVVFLRVRTTGEAGWWRALERRRVRTGMLAAVGFGLVAVLAVNTFVELSAGSLLAHQMTAGLYVVYTPLAVLLVAALAWGPTGLGSVLEHRWAITLGDASYSFYMLQWSFLLVATEIAGGRPGWWLSMATIGVLTVVSLASARWIESPARRLLRGRVPAATDTRLDAARHDRGPDG
jgi:peptidoglycan/LPS O-acetylase OafA/YrhL